VSRRGYVVSLSRGQGSLVTSSGGSSSASLSATRYARGRSSIGKRGDITKLERRHFLGTGLGSILIPTLAAAQTQAAKPGGSGQLGLGNVPLAAASAGERLNELGPENARHGGIRGLVGRHRDGVG
jgi:hypothetical protein